MLQLKNRLEDQTHAIDNLKAEIQANRECIKGNGKEGLESRMARTETWVMVGIGLLGFMAGKVFGVI